MRKILSVVTLLAILSSCSVKPEKTGMTWEKYRIDAHRTGVTAPNADNVPEALGTIAGDGSYTAPNGKVFTDGTVPAVAAILVDSQKNMAEVKEVIAYSTRFMTTELPESALSNFVVDIVASETQRLTGNKVDVGVTNFGGIRVDMPEGDVQLDDIRSMFPFKNNLVWVQLSGTALLRLMNEIAEYGPQCVSGVQMVISDHKLESVLVGGKPIDPKKKYGVATVDFLLDGGDHIHVAQGASKLVITDHIVGDVIEQYIRNLTAEGKPIEYHTDGRVVLK